MAKKEVNKEVINFAVQARNKGMTYGQLQAQETLRKLQEDAKKRRKRVKK